MNHQEFPTLRSALKPFIIKRHKREGESTWKTFMRKMRPGARGFRELLVVLLPLFIHKERVHNM